MPRNTEPSARSPLSVRALLGLFPPTYFCPLDASSSNLRAAAYLSLFRYRDGRLVFRPFVFSLSLSIELSSPPFSGLPSGLQNWSHLWSWVGAPWGLCIPSWVRELSGWCFGSFCVASSAANGGELPVYVADIHRDMRTWIAAYVCVSVYSFNSRLRGVASQFSLYQNVSPEEERGPEFQHGAALGLDSLRSARREKKASQKLFP